MRIGVQFTGTVKANKTKRWFTHSWPENWHVVWNVVPTSPRTSGAQIEWDVEVKRQSSDKITYYISIKNKTGSDVNIEARYAILN